jgi:hypothetical protein
MQLNDIEIEKRKEALKRVCCVVCVMYVCMHVCSLAGED